MRKRFYIGPKSINIYDVETILEEWLENNNFEMLDLDKLNAELDQELKKFFPWGRVTVEMQMIEGEGFEVDIVFFDTNIRELRNITATILW